MTALWLFLRTLSPRTWLITGASVLVLTAGTCGVRWHARAIADAKQSVRDSIGTAAQNAAPAQRDTVYLTRERTDQTGRAATRQAARVDTIAQRVPDTVRVAYPVVDTLVLESLALADTTRQLRADQLTERAAAARYAATLQTITVTVRDSLHVEQARPKRTWRSNTVLTLGGAILGAALTLLTSH